MPFLFASNRIVDRTNRGQTWTIKLYETSRDTDHAMKARLIIVRTDDILHPVTNLDMHSVQSHTQSVFWSAHIGPNLQVASSLTKGALANLLMSSARGVGGRVGNNGSMKAALSSK